MEFDSLFWKRFALLGLGSLLSALGGWMAFKGNVAAATPLLSVGGTFIGIVVKGPGHVDAGKP